MLLLISNLDENGNQLFLEVESGQWSPWRKTVSPVWRKMATAIGLACHLIIDHWKSIL